MLPLIEGIAWFVGLFALAAFVLRPYFKRREAVRHSVNWPIATGTVETLSEHSYDGRGVPIWWVGYSYSVGGEIFSGTLTCDAQPPLNSAHQVDVETVYPKGSAIRVRYNPMNPSESVGLGKDEA